MKNCLTDYFMAYALLFIFHYSFFIIHFLSYLCTMYKQQSHMGNKLTAILLAAILPLLVQAQAVRVACVGNSITEGYALAHPETESYPAVLQQMLGQGYEVGNFGMSGHTLMNKGNKPYMATQRYKDALAFSPDIVTIMLGTNDTKPVNWAHRDGFERDMRTMVAAFQALPSRPKVCLCLPVPAPSGQWGINDSIITHGVIPVIRRVAADLSLTLIDLNAAMRPYPEYYTDGVHPDKRGARVIAACIRKAIEELKIKNE